MEVVRVEAPNLLTQMWWIWVQAAISMLGRKAALTIERISVHASFVTIYAHQAYILQCLLCFVHQGRQLSFLLTEMLYC